MGWIADLLKEIPSAARYKAELETMEKENLLLQQEVSSLESENKNLRQEIQRRDDIIQNEKSHNKLLDETEIDVLKFLSENESQDIDQITCSLNIKKQMAIFYLEELCNREMVNDSRILGGVTLWSLGQEGRRYLIDNKLIAK